MSEEFVPWHSYADIAIAHTCDEVQEFLRDAGVPDSALEQKVLSEQRVFGVDPDAIIMTAAACAALAFKALGCDCSRDSWLSENTLIWQI